MDFQGQRFISSTNHHPRIPSDKSLMLFDIYRKDNNNILFLRLDNFVRGCAKRYQRLGSTLHSTGHINLLSRQCTNDRCVVFVHKHNI